MDDEPQITHQDMVAEYKALFFEWVAGEKFMDDDEWGLFFDRLDEIFDGLDPEDQQEIIKWHRQGMRGEL